MSGRFKIAGRYTPMGLLQRSSEEILRGAYFGNGENRRFAVSIFCFAAIVMWLVNLRHIFQGYAVLSDGILTREGFYLTLRRFLR